MSLENLDVFRLLKEIILRLLCHLSTVSVCGIFTRCLLRGHLLQGHIQVHRMPAVHLIKGFEIHTVRAEP
jgi:hypothetical protein